MTTKEAPSITSKAIGFHLYADNSLLKYVSDRFVWQTLYNIVNKQRSVSETPAEVRISLRELAYLAGINEHRTVSLCLKRLEKLGLIKKKNLSIIVEFDNYIKIIRFFESLSTSSQTRFKKDFKNIGTLAFDKWTYHRTHRRYANPNNVGQTHKK